MSKKHHKTASFLAGLAYLDPFSLPPSFEIESRRVFATSPGGLFMLSVLLLGTFYAINQIIIVSNKENPKVIIEGILDDSPQPIQVNNQNFPLAFAITLNNTVWTVDPRILEVSVKFKYLKRYSNVSNIQTVLTADLETTSCRKEFFRDYPSDYSILHLNNYFCINYTNYNQGVNLTGQFSSGSFSYIMINVERCLNSTVNGTCASSQEIDRIVNQLRLETVYQHSLFNPKDYEHSRQAFLDSTYYYHFTASNYLQVNWFIQNRTLQTDNSFIGRTTDEIDQINDLGNTQMIINPASTHIFTLYLRSDFKREVIYRSYMKIEEMLAGIGAIINFCLLFGGLALVFFNKFLLEIKLINSLYNLAPKTLPTSPEMFKKDRQGVLERNSIKITTRIDTMQPCLTVANIKAKPDKFPQVKISEFRSLVEEPEKCSFSWFHVILRIFGERTLFGKSYLEKARSFRSARKKLKEDLDFISILKKIQEIDKIKRVLLSEDQVRFFDLIPGAEVETEKAGYQEELTIEDLFHSFKELRRDSACNEVSQRLLSSQNSRLLDFLALREKDLTKPGDETH